MDHSTEHFTPAHTSPIELEINLDRYAFVLPFLKDKIVVDLGCGSGLGTYFYSLFAKHVYAVDYDAVAIEETHKWPFPRSNVDILHLDITQPAELAKIPEHDLTVALEVLEHVDDPAAILRGLKAPQLVFSVPLKSLEVSSWHKFDIQNDEDVRKMISAGSYQIGRLERQSHPRMQAEWIRGEATRFSQ